MSQNYENVALTEDEYVIFLERTDYVNAQRRYEEWQGKESSKTIEINIPCDSLTKRENLAVILQIIIHPESVPSNAEIDIVYAYQTAIYLQSKFLEDQLLSHFVNDGNCTKLMIEILNLVGPTDPASEQLFIYMERNFSLSKEKVLAAAISKQAKPEIKYVYRRLYQKVRDVIKHNKRILMHFPHDLKCTYCHKDIDLHDKILGEAATIQNMPCCALLAHISCNLKNVAKRYPSCPTCATPLEGANRVDVDSECLDTVIKRMLIRDAHNIPRCYPHHSKYCYTFPITPKHKGKL